MYLRAYASVRVIGLYVLLVAGLKDKKSWSEPDLSALWCEKVWFKVVGGQL